MTHTSWFVIIYGVGLFYLLIHQDNVRDKNSFRITWILYCLAIMSSGVFALFKAGCSSSRVPSSRIVKNLALIDIWSTGLTWLLLGLSLLILLRAVMPSDVTGSKPSQ